MKLKEIEYFLVVEKTRSFKKAAIELYTSQPNVSKRINKLETELGYKLFVREYDGLKLTERGQFAKLYAQQIIDLSNEMNNIKSDKHNSNLNISSYRSHLISHILADFLKNQKDNIKVNHKLGSIDSIVNDVNNGESEVGLVYISVDKIHKFNNIIESKKLLYHEIAQKEICLYVGENNPIANQKEISIEQLKDLKFVRGSEDYFAIEDNLVPISLGINETDIIDFTLTTNSDLLYMEVLLKTDLCSLGIDLFCKNVMVIK